MPEIEQIAADYRGRVRVVKVDVLKDMAAMKAFDTTRLPGLLLFRDGVEVDRLLPVPGLVSWRLRNMLDPYVAAPE